MVRTSHSAFCKCRSAFRTSHSAFCKFHSAFRTCQSAFCFEVFESYGFAKILRDSKEVHRERVREGSVVHPTKTNRIDSRKGLVGRFSDFCETNEARDAGRLVTKTGVCAAPGPPWPGASKARRLPAWAAPLFLCFPEDQNHRPRSMLRMVSPAAG